tara:strand:+ start:79 stop:642 length:564 start_codon:yes stop_codon:yes gene_type:complete
VVRYASGLAAVAQLRKATTAPSCRVYETYVKVRGERCYLYRAIDRNGQTLEFMLSEHRDEEAVLRFLAQAISSNGLPRACAIDNSRANTTGLKEMNVALRKVGSDCRIRVYRSKYLNNIVEQDHRGLKRRIRPMLGFKSFRSATATLDGIDTAHMIRKGQLDSGCPFETMPVLRPDAPPRQLFSWLD